MNPVSDPAVSAEDVGVRAARARLSGLIDSVESGDHIVYLTRSGHRVAALVGSSTADGILAIQGAESPAIPGDLAGAITLVENLLNLDSGLDLKRASSERHELIGGFMALVDLMLSGPALNYGDIRVNCDDGSVEHRYVADIVVRRLFAYTRTGDIQPEVMPILAGCLWAAQVGESALVLRQQIPVPVTPKEMVAWILTLREICRMINIINGDGTAEGVMYRYEEMFREEQASLSDP